MMRYWNSREILDGIFEIIPIDGDPCADAIVDFVVDLVRIHNFQTESPQTEANSEVSLLIAKFVSNWSAFIVEETMRAYSTLLDAHRGDDEDA